jgi:hypothetical protein
MQQIVEQCSWPQEGSRDPTHWINATLFIPFPSEILTGNPWEGLDVESILSNWMLVSTFL